MTTEVGFCSRCRLVRQDDELGPVTPCACFVDHHAQRHAVPTGSGVDDNLDWAGMYRQVADHRDRLAAELEESRRECERLRHPAPIAARRDHQAARDAT